MQSSRASEQTTPAAEQGAPDRPAGENADATTGEEERHLAAELERLEDRYKRALADLDNYRKRSARETERRVEESRDAQLREWLEVVDSLERALFMGPEDPVMEGLRAVLDQVEAVLARQGVERVGAPGQRFDPERHEAVGVRPSADFPDHTVVEVARSGFARNGRIVRPAEVIVSRAEPSGG